MKNDSELYTESKEYVKQYFSDIYNASGDTVIISISRKGPKFLERLLGRNVGNTCNTITEVALPFFALKHFESKVPMRVVIFDDAIYYGTTVEGIYRELCAFERLYGINTSKELYTAIRSKESKNNLGEHMKGVGMHSYNNDRGVTLRPGYGHYFIRRLEEDLSELNNTLEVEFPIVEFEADEIIDEKLLYNTFRDYYGDCSVFEVNHYRQTSISILLDKKNIKSGQSFRKLRIYIDGKNMRVVCMGPWILPNDMSVMLGLFDDSRLHPLWRRLMLAYTFPMESLRKFKADYFVGVERCIRKSLVIMANYLLSFRLLIEEQEKMMRAFNISASNVKYKGLNLNDLFYLLGDLSLCDEVRKSLDFFWNNPKDVDDAELMPNIKAAMNTIDYQVFENENFPEKEELDIFNRHNQDMLGNCQNINQSMSVMFFNQTALIEKWSRRNTNYDFGRLRFGYTFHSLYRSLIESGKMRLTDDYIREVNLWMDHRIDQACIVPQYVVDRKTNLWCRVFRPGENEDALLNHMARFVIAVYKLIEKVLGLGWVYEHYFKEMLCLSAMSENNKWIKESFEFELEPDRDNRTLKFKYERGETSDVLNFMVKMNILKLENGMVSVSTELPDDEIGEATTLDNHVIEEIDRRLTEITKKIVDYKYQNYTFFVTNLYFFNTSDMNQLKHLNESLVYTLKELVPLIEGFEGGDQLRSRLLDGYYKTQKYIVGADLLIDQRLMVERFPQDSVRRDYIRELLVLWMIKSTYELAIITFLGDKGDLLRKEIESSLESPLVYGYPLSLSQDEATQLQEMLIGSASLESIRKKILSIVKEHIAGIPSVKV